MLIVDTESDPAFNLAAEEYLLRELDAPVIRLWRNRPCVVIGRHQIPCMEVNLLAAKELGIPVFRRISGGGTVYHDLGNLNFSFIGPLPKGEGIDFDRMLRPIVRAMDALGLPVEHVGRGDVRIGGSKISGNAAYLWRGRCLHHGTLLYDANLDALERLLDVPEKSEWKARSVRSVRSPVTQISSLCKGRFDGIEDFAQALAKELSGEAPRAFDAEERKKINALRESRYATREWNLGETPEYALERDTASLGRLRFRVRQGLIRELSLSEGGTGHTPAPSALSEGCWHEPESVAHALLTLPEELRSLTLADFF